MVPDVLGALSSKVIRFQSRCGGPGFSGRLLDCCGGAGAGGAAVIGFPVELTCDVVLGASGVDTRSRDRCGRGLSSWEAFFLRH